MCSSLANIGMDILFTTSFSHIFTHGVDAFCAAQPIGWTIATTMSLGFYRMEKWE